VRGWAELLCELERIDFELARQEDVDAAEVWLRQRAELLGELNELPEGSAGRSELVRLSSAAQRGAALSATWRARKAQMRAEAENLFAAQLLLKAVAPERRGQHFSIES
jgi:hypothetical protein